MFTLPFWIVFTLGLLVSLGISVRYGRKAIHPRLRPHFGQVVVVFLVLALVSFFVAVVLGRLIGGGLEDFDPEKMRDRKPGAPAPSSEPAEEPADPIFQ